MKKPNLEQVQKLRCTLDQLFSESATLFNAIESDPLSGSIADTELREFIRPLSIKTAHDQSYLLIESSADYLSCLIKSITEPVETIAPWSLTRSILESSAMSIWIGSPNISSIERAHRSLAFRLKGIQEQVKLKINDNYKDVFDKLIEVAKEIEAKVIIGKNGFPTRLGAQFPKYTNLCESELGEATTFKVLSSLTHSQPFAMIQLSLKLKGPSKKDIERLNAEKHIDNISIAWLCNRAAFAFIRAMSARLKLYGYLTAEVISIFRQHSDTLKITEEQFRFCIWSS
jgi:hypothetical protein